MSPQLYSEKSAIFLSLPIIGGYGQSILQGAREAILRDPVYKIKLLNGGLDSLTKRVHSVEKPCAVLAFMLSEKMEQNWLATGASIINLSSRYISSNCPTVTVDNEAIGRLGAQHLLERGYRHLYFSRNSNIRFATERANAFIATAREHDVQAIDTWPLKNDGWLTESSSPIGVMCDFDGYADKLINTALARKLSVPEDVAILGVDNDILRCESAAVSISSIDSNGKQVGRLAVELAQRMLAGETVDPGPIRVPPVGVVARSSTDNIAIDDPQLRSALAYIALHAHEPITLNNILESVTCSRRTLELKFAKHLSRTPHEEIHRVRLERVRQLLKQTNLTVSEIAERCGYTNLGRFYQRFQSAENCTPSTYRQRHS